MTLDEYQVAAMRTAAFPPGAARTYPVLGLAEEAGEVAGKYAKFLRDGGCEAALREAIRKELGDCLWMIAAVADGFGLSLNAVAAANLAKLLDRQTRGSIRGSGDER